MLPKTKIIPSVLSPAVRLWLRSQLESAKTLEFKLEGSDRQILSGEIPQVFVLGDTVVYRGLRLSRLEITGQAIKVNLGQILRGKPLRLVQPIMVLARMLLREGDLNACLQSPLLSKVLTELLDQWLSPLADRPDLELTIAQPHQWQQIHIAFLPDRLQLWATLVRDGEVDLPVEMGAIVDLVNSNTIYLKELQWSCEVGGIQTALESLQQLTLDLGTDVEMEALQVEQGQVSCQGKLLIRP